MNCSKLVYLSLLFSTPSPFLLCLPPHSCSPITLSQVSKSTDRLGNLSTTTSVSTFPAVNRVSPYGTEYLQIRTFSSHMDHHWVSVIVWVSKKSMSVFFFDTDILKTTPSEEIYVKKCLLDK